VANPSEMPGAITVAPLTLAAYQDGAVVSRILLKRGGGTVTLFAFDEGQSLSEHTAPFDAVAHVLETRRPAGKQMPEKLAREEARIERAVTVAESRFRGGPFLVGGRFTLADLILGVALQYVDFRCPNEWRAKCPKLAAWHEPIAARRSFQDTLPPGFTALAA